MALKFALNKLKKTIGASVNYRIKIKKGAGTTLVPVIAGIGRAHLDNAEPHIEATLRMLYKPDRMLVDVGVNIGQTLIKYHSIGGSGIRYVGFDPNPVCCFYSEKLIHENGIKNAKIVPIALGNEKKILELLVTGDGPDPGASMVEGYRDSSYYSKKKYISVFPGDEVFFAAGITQRGFILKIDVEGAELDVIMGLERTLRDLRPTVIMEILPPANFSSEVNERRVNMKKRTIEFMEHCGFTWANIREDGSVDSAGVPTCDYLFLPTTSE